MTDKVGTGLADSGGFLDSIFGNSTVLGTGFDKLSSFGERIFAMKIGADQAEAQAQAQANATPFSDLIPSVENEGARLVIYAGGAVALGFVGYMIFKKVF